MLLYGRLIFGFVEYAMVETRRDMVETRHVSTVKKKAESKMPTAVRKTAEEPTIK